MCNISIAWSIQMSVLVANKQTIIRLTDPIGREYGLVLLLYTGNS